MADYGDTGLLGQTDRSTADDDLTAVALTPVDWAAEGVTGRAGVQQVVGPLTLDDYAPGPLAPVAFSDYGVLGTLPSIFDPGGFMRNPRLYLWTGDRFKRIYEMQMWDGADYAPFQMKLWSGYRYYDVV